MKSLSVTDLLGAGERLCLSIQAGRDGLNRSIRSVSIRRIPPFLRPLTNEICLIEKINGCIFSPDSRNRDSSFLTVRERSSIPCLIASEGASPGWTDLEAADRAAVPFLTSLLNADLLESRLFCFLREKIEGRRILGGVLVNLSGRGILIIGSSGSGKSTCALELISRGGTLVADDVVELQKTGRDRIFGASPQSTRCLIEIKGQGIVDLRERAGDRSVSGCSSVEFVVELEKDRHSFGAETGETNLLGVKLPTLRIGRTVPVHDASRIEDAVRNWSGSKRFHAPEMGWR